MLNGIGGHTLAEAKHNMSMREFNLWQKYRNKRGSLNIGRRLQQELAHLHHSFIVSKGGTQVEIQDLMCYEDPPSVDDKLHQLFGI